MHRSYRPIRPTQSRLLQQKWDQDYYEGHRRRLESVRPQVDTRPPNTYMHLHFKPKKLQLEEERLSTIDRDNRILLERMAHIVNSKGDCYNDYERKSLNRERRMREMMRVAEENQQMLKRIESVRPKYSNAKWEREWQANLQLIDQMSAYPPEWWKYQDQGRTTSRSTSTTTGQQDSKSSADRSSSREKSAVSQREKIDVNDKKYCEKTGKSSAKYRDKQSTSMSPASEEKEEVNNS